MSHYSHTRATRHGVGSARRRLKAELRLEALVSREMETAA